MSLKTAALIGLFGAAFSLLLQVLMRVAVDLFRINPGTLSALYFVPSICYLVFFITFYLKYEEK